MNRYQLIRGFSSFADADDYAQRLPHDAAAKAAPYSSDGRTLFAVDVRRSYVGGRL
jgi:hypothetical protein